MFKICSVCGSGDFHNGLCEVCHTSADCYPRVRKPSGNDFYFSQTTEIEPYCVKRLSKKEFKQ